MQIFKLFSLVNSNECYVQLIVLNGKDTLFFFKRLIEINKCIDNNNERVDEIRTMILKWRQVCPLSLPIPTGGNI